MGLDTTHGCWRGAYSAFNRWRNTLATVSGHGLMKVPLMPGMPPMLDVPQVDWNQVPEDAVMGQWPECPEDPLLILFVHADCEGIIMAEHTAALADRLEELLPALDGHNGGEGDRTRQFIAGLRLAASAGEDVGFH